MTRNTEKKAKENKIKNGISYEKNGWQYISISGNARERGYAYGYLCAKQFKEIQKMMQFIVYEDTGKKWDYFVEMGKKVLQPQIKEGFPEFFDEMEAIAHGCTEGGTPTTLDEILAWNNYITLMDSWYPNQSGDSAVTGITSREGGAKDHCSAFLANGDYTTDGKIVMAHNSFCNFVDGQYYNTILDILPEKGHGHRILMQTMPCSIWSGTDFFVTSKGIVGTETTIGGFLPYENNYPISCRIRQAMQYGNSLDDYVDILKKGNSGDYANSWLLGDIHTNEILRLELGLKYVDVKRTHNGYFFGCNVAFDPQIRNLECADTGYCDVRRHQGSRQVRLPDLIEKHKGRINIEVAKQIISDHYDVYLKKVNPCSRTVCSHYELDAREYMSDPSRPKPFQPRGAIDGSVLDTASAKDMSFYMRYGNSCGTPFSVAKFCNEHRQWKQLEPYLKDRPQQPWTPFGVTDIKETNTLKRTKKMHLTKKNKTKGKKRLTHSNKVAK
jgi:hypothetical protein